MGSLIDSFQIILSDNPYKIIISNAVNKAEEFKKIIVSYKTDYYQIENNSGGGETQSYIRFYDEGDTIIENNEKY